MCKQIDPTELFQPAEQVAQSIILSLIQQLSINLTEETDLKTKYVFMHKSFVFSRFGWNVSSEVTVSIRLNSEACSEPCQTVNCFQPFTIFAPISNLAIWQVSEYASGIDIFSKVASVSQPKKISSYLRLISSKRFTLFCCFLLLGCHHTETSPFVLFFYCNFLYRIILFYIVSFSHFCFLRLFFFTLYVWSNGLVIKALDSQSRCPLFKATGWLEGRLSLLSSRGRSNEYQGSLGTCGKK